MADDTPQNQQSDAPMPDWLKNAQAVAVKDGGTGAGTDGGAGTAVGADPSGAQQGGQQGAQLGAQQAGASSQTTGQTAAVTEPIVTPVATPSTTVPVADAPVPEWLKKAAEKASTPATPVAEAKPDQTVSATLPEPAVVPEPTLVQPEPVVIPPLPESEPKTATATQLPGWLQKIQREEKAGVEPAAVSAVPASSAVPAVNAEPIKPDVSVPVVVVEKPVEQAMVAESAQPAPVASATPAGLLETRPENGSKTVVSAEVEKPPVAAVVPAVTPVPGAESTPVAEIAPAPTKEKAKEKMDLFKSAESTFLSFLGKGAKAVEKGQTAGQPKTGEQAKSAEAALTKEAGAPAAATGKAEVAPTKAATGKAAEDKATIEERRQLVDAEKIYQQGIATIRDLIAPSSMEIRYDMLRVEGMYAQSFYVYAYPRYLDTNWMSPVVNFDVTMDISQFIYPIDSATIMRVLKKKVAQMQASVRINAEKGMVSDPALDTALQDAEELRTSIQRGQEKFFQFALYFTIYSEDEKKIAKISKQLESILGGKLILTKKTELQMEHGFNSSLPMCLDELEVSLNMNTSPLSSTFPFTSSDLTSNEGILYGLNRHNDSLIIFDRFSLENANSVVFAKSGAGKSYCVKLEILRAMMVGTDVIVIDPENEYEALAQTVGGAYLRVSLTSDRRINPFDLPAPFEGEEVQPGDLLRQNIISLHGLLKIMLGGVTPEEEGILDKALNDVYNLKGITMELVDPSSIPAPTMEDLYDILVSMEGGTSLAQRLQKFTVGTYSGIFNKPTNVDLETGLMVFCIRDLEDALRPIAMYIILNYIWNRVRSKLKKRILVIDEAWTMMQHDDSARFLFGLVKRARKYYLGITTITQDVEDFVKSPYGKPVVTNSSMQLLLKQAPAAIDVLSKVFNLTEGEKYMLLNSGVGQGLFFAGLKHVAIQIIASYTEDKIVTTNPEEILRGRDTAESYQT